MYKIGDVVVYGTDGICSIIDETIKEFGKEKYEYFVLCPVDKKADVIYVPKSNERILSKMRHIISKDEAKLLIDNIPTEVMDWIENERDRQMTFKNVLLYGTTLDLISMTHLLYIKQIEQLEVGKKLHAQDERFLRDAERMLFEELSYILELSQNEVIKLLKTNEAAK